MKKQKKPRKLLKVSIALAVLVIIVGTVLIASSARSADSANTRNQELQTITLEKTDISRTISVSGVVESANVVNIYSTQAYPVKEIYVKLGDSVKAGDVLAELDMARLENDLSQAEINLRSAVISAEEEVKANNNSVVNARTSLASSRISLARQERSTANAEKELKDAEEKMSEDFDSAAYDKAIEDAKLALERRTTDLENAQEDLDKAINDFDDYAYQNAITDAKTNIDKRRDELADAQWASGGASSVSLGGYQNAVAAAQSVLDIRKQALSNAQEALEALESANVQDGEAIAAARALVEKATSEHATAQIALQSANRDLENARKNAAASDTGQSRVDSARYALKDAQNAYDRAVTNLERAKNDAADIAEKALTNAQNMHSDAQRAYQRALDDKIRAIDNDADRNQTGLENAQRLFEDSKIQLESSHNNLESAQNSLNQASSRPATGTANVEIQELNILRLNNQLKEGRVIATADGVITELNAKVGANPAGVIFVIENTEDLYVSAKVREHNVSAVMIGQDAVITTEATGDRPYAGLVSFISPRAVSAAGSTSVEFEVRAGLIEPDKKIKIGMNAFLDIVIEKRSGIYAVPNTAIVTDDRGSFVYAMKDGERVEIAVALGIRTMVSAEISGEGLYDGLELVADPEGLLSAGAESPLFMRFGG